MARVKEIIDLAIQNAPTPDDDKLLHFRRYLSEIPTLYKIDLVDMRYGKPL